MNKSITKHITTLTLSSLLFVSSAAFSNNLIQITPELTLQGAKVIASAATKKAQSENWNVVIAITDAAGYLKYLERMENVQLSALEVAIEKAKTSVMYSRPTQAFEDRVRKGDIPVTMLPDLLPFSGGVPIRVDGKIIGAIGVSGVKSTQDAEIAQAGIDALLEQLKK
ncbi:heme-binding protein [Colwellia sp. E2M01]|uniref:GlcG/HbpS family heme-binding protein n=1 Tax=Colwellia sp. E2M01 TaxID=2841561 RepID=UPI001C0942A3|nr:heme-binding protein [Colwellia sp. E2M01]MBU2869625.1 heme-binding protein [Colwellia sp. E2M01]